MQTKLTTAAQLAKLRTGDIVKRFPTQGETPQDNFDESSPKHIDTFEVRSINASNEMVELVTAAAFIPLFASAGEICRVFIKAPNLINEKVWWV